MPSGLFGFLEQDLSLEIGRHTVLVVVDVQNDFCPGGTLPVSNGDSVVPVLNKYIERFLKADAPIIFTRDWHPVDHSSFKAQGGPWPPHCIQNSLGARFHPELLLPPEAEIVSKGDRRDEAYSFFQGTDLAAKLHQRGLSRLMVGGLATDYCVKETVIDGMKHGFEVYFLNDASRGVEVKPGDCERALREMIAKGAKQVALCDLAQ